MNKLYIILGAGLFIIGSYWSGARIASEKCRAEFAKQQNIDIQNIIKIKGKINAETYNTATVDIRGRLRDKYTIKD
ncbi:MAG: hypothetical protein JW974_02130 [Alphaproteobacteria bacterium]|nr:hypothetical protein [Alphaproteobacteria bacterium]MBN2675018.1 hypothetical protein [Alphaproteobacteria bacterium]